MSPDRDEETKTLLPNDDTSKLPIDVNQPGHTLATKALSLRAIYVFCFFVLVLNAGLLAVSWRAQQEIKNLYSSMGRDVTKLPRPDPFAGLSDAGKSENGVLPDY